MPRFHQHDCEFGIDDAWWRDAGMIGFSTPAKAYRAAAPEPGYGRDNLPVFIVRVEDVAVCCRQLSHGVFNNSPDLTAEERVGRILKGFQDGAAIPPVEVVRLSAGSGVAFKLAHGAHRFYCAVAAGVSEVPAIEVADPAFEDV
jgi:hypothetical protein